MGVRQRETNDLPRRSDFREFGQITNWSRWKARLAQWKK